MSLLDKYVLKKAGRYLSSFENNKHSLSCNQMKNVVKCYKSPKLIFLGDLYQISSRVLD